MVDPVTVEVIRNAAIFAAEEMGVVLRNTAFSPNIRDRLDFSCAILDPGGELVAQAEHIPVHLGSMSIGAKNMVKTLEEEGLELGPGDVAIANNPYITGTHLNDVMVLKPVYAGGRLVAYVANKAHHVDIGGLVPGGIGAGARSLREEGLVIPPLKIVEAGRLRRDVLRLLEENVRTPRYLRGDLMAQLAALNTGEKRVLELVERYTATTLLEAWSEILGYTERYTRRLLERLVGEEGVYTAEDYLELPGGGEAVIRLSLHVARDSIVADYTGSSRQVDAPLNAVYGVTVAATSYAVKAVVDPAMPMNSGFLRVLRVVAPEGTIVNPQPPAPVGGGNVETSQRIADVALKALAKAFPGRVPAASCGTMSNLLLGGEGWAFYETIGCGSGARPSGDGVDGVHTNMTNTLNTPIEVAEQEYPVLFERYELRPDSGGPGRWRGGLGVVRSIKLLEPATVSVFAERCRRRPWGLEGGGEGAGFRFTVRTPDGRVEEKPCKTVLHLPAGSVVTVETPGGGGYGDPCSRPRELVERDLRDGKVSPEAARRYYCYSLSSNSQATLQKSSAA